MKNEKWNPHQKGDAQKGKNWTFDDFSAYAEAEQFYKRKKKNRGTKRKQWWAANKGGTSSSSSTQKATWAPHPPSAQQPPAPPPPEAMPGGTSSSSSSSSSIVMLGGKGNGKGDGGLWIPRHILEGFLNSLPPQMPPSTVTIEDVDESIRPWKKQR